MEYELDERKTKILNAIIKNYLETGEPVGSRTISKFSDLNLSSATIRNEMADLEEMGYLVQPHTSAGRIPSDQGYRFYVDHVIMEKDREISEVKELMIERTDKLEVVLKQVVRTLAQNTNYATMIAGPSYHKSRIKFIQLSTVDERQLLAVIIMEGNRVKNHIIPLSEALDTETVLKLNLLLNTSLNGLSIDEINLGVISAMKEQAGIHSGIVSDVLDLLAGALHEEEDLQVYTSGTTNILKYPELSTSGKTEHLLTAFEEKAELAEFLNTTVSGKDETGIQIYIGEESPIATMKDCSVVTAKYDFGENLKGVIGIVGPKRMDYENVVDNLNTLRSKLDEVFRKPSGTS